MESPVSRLAPILPTPSGPLAVHAKDGLLSQVLTQLSSKHPWPLVGLAEQQSALARALDDDQSSSLLLVGKRGSGKSHLLSAVLSRGGAHHLVTLNGHTHPSDEAALQDCIRQLAEAEGDPLLLEQLHAVATNKGSFSDHLKYLLDFLRESRQRKRLVLVLEEFDCFAHSTRQKLLYNLLDLTSHKAASVCLIGLTERVDVMQTLEKRVRSRFEHRQIFLPSPPPLDQVLAGCRARLQVTTGHKSWNDAVAKLLDEAPVRALFAQNHALGYPMGWFLRWCHLAVLRLGVALRPCVLQLSDLQQALQRLTQDPKTSLARNLPKIDMTVLLSMIALERVNRLESYTFEHVFKGMDRLRAVGDTRDLVEPPVARAVALKAFENLLRLGLVQFDSADKKEPQEFRYVRHACDVDEVLGPLATSRQSSATTWWAARLQKMVA